MADSKITALTAISTVDPTADPLVIVDVSDTSMAASGTTKKSTINQLLGAGGTATLASATITGDLTVDTNVLKVDSSGNRVSVNTTTFATDSAFAVKTTAGKFDVRAAGSLSVKLNSDQSMLYNVPTGNAHLFQINDSDAMTLNSTGLGVGVSPAFKIHANGVIGTTNTFGAFTALQTAGGTGYRWTLANDNNFYLQYSPDGFGSTATSRIALDSSGNVGIGVTPSYRLTVQGADNSVIAQFGGTNRQVRLSTSAVSAVDNASFNFIHTSGSGRFTFQNNSGTQTMLTIDDNGNNILRMPVTPPTLGVNLEGTFNLTSNTNLRISVRGTDGVTRVANITLAP